MVGVATGGGLGRDRVILGSEGWELRHDLLNRRIVVDYQDFLHITTTARLMQTNEIEWDAKNLSTE